MIHIKKPYLENTETHCSSVCEIQIDDSKYDIWFRVEKRYEKYLCIERSDAYVIGLLNYAQRNHHDIVCDVPITEDLLYSIEKDLIPSLANYGINMYKTKIIAESAPALQEGFAVGTGASFGIDSFSTIYNHIASKYPAHNLTHLCINNVGAFNECYDNYGANKVKEERYIIAQQIADELGMELIKTDSNFGSEIYQNHLQTQTYSSTFAIFMLQKLWKIYYLASSGEDYSNFSVVANDKNSSALYELLSLSCFSIPGLKIYSEGGAKTRLEKTTELINYLPAQKHVHVCLTKPYNCGVCSKCMRTLVTLDLLGVVDSFSEAFDVEYYKANRKKYLNWLCDMHFRRDKMNEPVYHAYLQQKGFKTYAFVRYIVYTIKQPLRHLKRICRYGKKRIKGFLHK